MYPLALETIRKALAGLERKGIKYRLEGFMWHQGENDPNPRGWKTIDRLAQVDPSWFCRLMPDETRPIRFAVIDSDTGSVETFTTLTLKRVAGQAQRITFKEADTDDTDDGERGASARCGVP